MANPPGRMDHASHPHENARFGLARLSTTGTRSRWNDFWSNLRDFISAPRVKTPSGPAILYVGESVRDPQFARVEALSVTIHVAILTLLIAPFLPVIVSPGMQRKVYPVTPLPDISAYFRNLKSVGERSGGGGGGGERNPLQETRGAAPPFNWIQLAVPRVRTQNPAYPVNPALLGPPQLRLPSASMDNWGNPLSPVITNSGGPGSVDGIGRGQGTGIGPGNGHGFGSGNDWGYGNGLPRSGQPGFSDVACVYWPQAQFSDEAVRAKYEGTVYLSLVVTADGRAVDVRVAKGLGMGLDEKAVEAVRAWRFKPAVGPDGKPAAVRATVEVLFHLY